MDGKLPPFVFLPGSIEKAALRKASRTHSRTRSVSRTASVELGGLWCRRAECFERRNSLHLEYVRLRSWSAVVLYSFSARSPSDERDSWDVRLKHAQN
jgi:hypothetical protein